LIERRNWIASDRLTDLADETEQLKRILGSILSRTRRAPTL